MNSIPWLRPKFGEKETQAVIEVMKSGWLTQGPQVAALEKDICNYLGCKHAVVVSNGTIAVLMAMMVANNEFTNKNRKTVVVVPASTFIASASPAKLMGWDVYVSDVNMDMQADDLFSEQVHSLAERFNVIAVPVHLSGKYCKSYEKIKNSEHIKIVHDACQAIGVKYKGKLIGGDFEYCAFSMHAGKVISSVEGGFVVTNNDRVAERLRSVRNHGMTKDYEAPELGINGRMTDIQAAIGRVQLGLINEFIGHRRLLSEMYENEFKELFDSKKLKSMMNDDPDVEAVDSFYGVYVLDKCLDLQKFLKEKGVDARRFFPSVSEQGAIFQEADQVKKPGAKILRDSVLLLPIGNGIESHEITQVIKYIKEFYAI